MKSIYPLYQRRYVGSAFTTMTDVHQQDTDAFCYVNIFNPLLHLSNSYFEQPFVLHNVQGIAHVSA